MARPKSGPRFERELSFPLNAMTRELMAEAAARDVNVQQHIYDILMERHNQRHGNAIAGETLWTPGAGTVVRAEPVNKTSQSSAKKNASAWASMLDDQ
jgi:hypothetical protein